jgi:hypothetical protein
MTLERFARVLDAYGASAERWPDDERGAALTLLERSAEARAARDAAARLDTLLDGVPATAPSERLVARVLAGVPAPASSPLRRPATVTRPRAARRVLTGIGAAATLAAAASLALWLAGGSTEAPNGPPTTAVAQLDVYDLPTDVLLSAADPDLADAAPAFGCDDPALDCENLPAPDAASSRSELTRKEMRA